MNKSIAGSILVVLLSVSIVFLCAYFFGEGVALLCWLGCCVLIVAIQYAMQYVVSHKYASIRDASLATQYLEKKVQNCFLSGPKQALQALLVSDYMKNGNHGKALMLFAQHPFLKQNVITYYFQMVLCAYYKHNQLMLSMNEKLQKVRRKAYQQQKQLGQELVEMVQTGKFNQHLFDTTVLPAVKEICLRYKTDKTENAEPLVVEDGDIAHLVSVKALEQDDKKSSPLLIALSVASVVSLVVCMYMQAYVILTTGEFLPLLVLPFTLVPIVTIVFSFVLANKRKTLSAFLIGFLMMVFFAMFIILMLS